VAPLMARAFPLYGMAPGVRLEGTTLAQVSSRHSEIEQRIQKVLDQPDAMFPVEGHPVMRPDIGFVDLVSTSQPPFHVSFQFGSYFWLRGSVSVGTIQPIPRLSRAVTGEQGRASKEP
jgi:hypothetical protein